MSSQQTTSLSSGHRPEILVGLSGGPDSTVVAHLLRKQGLGIVGLGVAFIDDKFMNFFSEEYTSSRSLTNLDRLKSFCEKINIPFYAVDASQEYFDRVFEPLLSARLCGQKFHWRLAESSLLMEILHQKSVKLGMKQVATGHYAKIHANHIRREYSLVTASDVPNDQSYLLAQMNQSALGRFFFPLGDLRRTEVQRLLQSFGEKLVQENEVTDPFAPDMAGKFFSKLVSADMNEPGTVHSFPTGIVVGEHQGIVTYELGTKNLPKEKFIGIVEKENVICKISPQNNKVYIGALASYKFQWAYLKELYFTRPMDSTKSFSFFAKLPGEKEPLACSLILKNNGSALLHLEKESPFLELGTSVIFYDRSGANAKLLGMGQVVTNENLSMLDRLELFGGGGKKENAVPRDPDNLRF